MCKCGLWLIKVILIIFALTAMVQGFIMIVAGVKPLLDKVNENTTRQTIALGIMLILVAGIGIYATIRENHYLLIAYALIFVTYFSITYLIATVLLQSTPKQGQIHAERRLKYLHMNRDNDEHIKMKLLQLQRTFNCCGLYGPNGHEVRPNDEENKELITDICCEVKDVKNSKCERSKAYKKGCLNTVVAYAEYASKHTGIQLMVASIYALLTIIITVILAWFVRRPQEVFEDESLSSSEEDEP